MLSADATEWTLICQCLKRAHTCLHRAEARRILDDDPTVDMMNLQEEPEITLLFDILSFYQNYRHLEMQMARLYPADPVKLGGPELDNMTRKVSVDFNADPWSFDSSSED